MKTIICDRCKNVCTESYFVEIFIYRGIKASDHKFDLCIECKKWLYKELDIKEDQEEK